MEKEVHREREAAEFLTRCRPSLCQGSGGQKLGRSPARLWTAAWHPSTDTTTPAATRTGGLEHSTLTTMTRMTGPAKLQMRGSWMEIQQKSGFP